MKNIHHMMTKSEKLPESYRLKVNFLISILIFENSVICNTGSLGIWIYQFSRDEAPNFKKNRAMALLKKSTQGKGDSL